MVLKDFYNIIYDVQIGETTFLENNLTSNPEIKPRGTFGRILENGVAMGPASRFALQVWYHHDVGSQEAGRQ